MRSATPLLDRLRDSHHRAAFMGDCEVRSCSVCHPDYAAGLDPTRPEGTYGGTVSPFVELARAGLLPPKVYR